MTAKFENVSEFSSDGFPPNTQETALEVRLFVYFFLSVI